MPYNAGFSLALSPGRIFSNGAEGRIIEKKRPGDEASFSLEWLTRVVPKERSKHILAHAFNHIKVNPLLPEWCSATLTPSRENHTVYLANTYVICQTHTFQQHSTT